MRSQTTLSTISNPISLKSRGLWCNSRLASTRRCASICRVQAVYSCDNAPPPLRYRPWIWRRYSKRLLSGGTNSTGVFPLIYIYSILSSVINRFSFNLGIIIFECTYDAKLDLRLIHQYSFCKIVLVNGHCHNRWIQIINQKSNL